MPLLLLLGVLGRRRLRRARPGETPRERVKAFFTRNPVALRGDRRPCSRPTRWRPTSRSTSRRVVRRRDPADRLLRGRRVAGRGVRGGTGGLPAGGHGAGRDGGRRCAWPWCPGLLFLFAAPLIDLPGAYLLQAAMPCGMNSMIVAHAYGLDVRIVGGVDHLVDRDRGARRGVVHMLTRGGSPSHSSAAPGQPARCRAPDVAESSARRGSRPRPDAPAEHAARGATSLERSRERRWSRAHAHRDLVADLSGAIEPRRRSELAATSGPRSAFTVESSRPTIEHRRRRPARCLPSRRPASRSRA